MGSRQESPSTTHPASIEGGDPFFQPQTLVLREAFTWRWQHGRSPALDHRRIPSRPPEQLYSLSPHESQSSSPLRAPHPPDSLSQSKEVKVELSYSYFQDFVKPK